MKQNLKAGLAGAGIFAASFASGFVSSYTGYGAFLAGPAQMGTQFFATLAAKFISSAIAQMIIGGILAALAFALAAVALVSLVNFVRQRMSAAAAPDAAPDAATAKTAAEDAAAAKKAAEDAAAAKTAHAAQQAAATKNTQAAAQQAGAAANDQDVPQNQDAAGVGSPRAN